MAATAAAAGRFRYELCCRSSSSAHSTRAWLHVSKIEATGSSAAKDGGFVHATSYSTVLADGPVLLDTSAARNGGVLYEVRASGAVLNRTSAGQDGGLVHAHEGSTQHRFNEPFSCVWHAGSQGRN